MKDERKQVKLPPHVWRALRKIAFDRETSMVKVIEEWTQRESEKAELSKQEFAA